jgi:hypothetical protein
MSPANLLGLVRDSYPGLDIHKVWQLVIRHPTTTCRAGASGEGICGRSLVAAARVSLCVDRSAAELDERKSVDGDRQNGTRNKRTGRLGELRRKINELTPDSRRVQLSKADVSRRVQPLQAVFCNRRIASLVSFTSTDSAADSV